MHILVDAGIPAAIADFAPFGPVRAVPGGEIKRNHLEGVDALIVRSITPVGEELLSGSSVRFVGSATAGVDHVNVPWLLKNGVTFAHAPGANADSVADYVVASLLTLALRKGRELEGLRMFVVGCGEVGSRVAERAAALGLEVLKNDPPKEEAGEDGEWVPLESGLRTADIVSVHVPLTAAGRHATAGLLGRSRLEAMREDAWLIHTARGGVVDEAALLSRVKQPFWRGAVVLDVWENEPCPNPDLIEAADIATPHIAGYAVESKARASRAMQRALAEFGGLPVPPPRGSEPIRIHVSAPLECEAPLSLERFLHALACSMYDIQRDDAMLRLVIPEGLREGSAFEALRSGYPGRHLFSSYLVELHAVPNPWQSAIRGALKVTG